MGSRVKGQALSFYSELSQWPEARVRGKIEAATLRDVDRVLCEEDLTPLDLAVLLSPAASQRLEQMARKATRLTRWHFGRTMGLYVPLYISNVCGADCTYCGYSVRSGNTEKRITLTLDTVRSECEILSAQGFQSVLLLTGEAPHAVSVDYIGQCIGIAREYFPSVSIEVYSLDCGDYEKLCALGLEGVTIYMETYDKGTYADVHLIGAKRDYGYRIDAIERAGRAGARRLSIGVLLGLYDWRVDGFWLAQHARYLQRVCWQSSLSLSFPRLRHVPKRFSIPRLVGDGELVQFMLAARLFLPEAGFNVSTRETHALRDRLIPLGTTMMSAGSSTRPGGYGWSGEEVLEQFEIEDRRRPAEVVSAIRAAGYDPVWKDFDRAFDEVGSK